MLRSPFDSFRGLVQGPYARSRCAVALLLLALYVFWPAAPLRAAIEGPYSHRQILDAIRWVESRNQPNPPDGDGGRAIGPYQIHAIYWRDANIGGRYQDCRRQTFAEEVIRAYMQRWVPRAWRDCDPEIIARTHNGGPKGRNKRATDRYWAKVRSRIRGETQP